MHDVNFVAVAVAALGAFLLGGLWYSKLLFLDRWNREAGLDPNRKGGHPAVVFGLAYVCAFIAAWVVAHLLAHEAHALHLGLMLGFGVSASTFGINYLFGGRSLVMWLIDAGYNTLLFVLMALVIAHWP
jgi:ABC-type Fe3+ transport system permease subunit